MVFSGKVFGMREEVAGPTKEGHKQAAGPEEVHDEVPVELLGQMRTAIKEGGAPVEASLLLPASSHASSLQHLSSTLYPSFLYSSIIYPLLLYASMLYMLSSILHPLASICIL